MTNPFQGSFRYGKIDVESLSGRINRDFEHIFEIGKDKNEYHKQKLAVLRTENLDDDEVYTEIVKTIESFKDQDYTLQFRYDKEFRKRKFVVLCFEK